MMKDWIRFAIGAWALFLVTALSRGADVSFAPALNTQVSSKGVDLKTGGADVIAVGVHTDGSTGPLRSFLLFDLSGVPATSTVLAARFEFKTQNNSGGALPASLTLARLDTTNVMSTSVSWTRIAAGVNWTSPGGDIGEVLGTLTPAWSNQAVYSIPSSPALLSAVEDAISNRAGILQMVLYAPAHEAAHPVPLTTGGFIRKYARNTPYPQALILTTTSDDPAPTNTLIGPWFGIDYNDAANVQAGYVNGGTVAAGVISNTTTSGFDGGAALTTLLTASSGNLQTRVRQDIGNTTLNALLRDLVFASNGDLELRIRGLDSRSYQFTAWFNDSGGGTPNGLEGDYEAVLDGVIMDSWSATYTLDAATGIGTCEFVFDGAQGSDTVIQINNTTAGKHAMINGFRLLQLPRQAQGTLVLIN